jgi:hypothetical protein
VKKENDDFPKSYVFCYVEFLMAGKAQNPVNLKPRCTSVDNIKTDLKQMGCVGMD